MLCPVRIRTANCFQTYIIPFESLRLEHNWLICRKVIVFTGSLLTLIYGLIIWITINYLNIESNKLLDPIVRQHLGKGYSTTLYIVSNALFGCFSIVFKSNLSLFFESCLPLEDKNINKTKIKIINRNESEFSIDLIKIHFKQKLKLIKKCLTISPLFTLNALFIVILIAFEFSLVKNGLFYWFENYSKIWFCQRNTRNTVLILNSCLTILFASVLLIQFCIFIYICDLINTQIDMKSIPTQLKSMSEKCVESRTKERPFIDYWQLRQQMNLQVKRQKNKLFHQFLYKEKVMQTNQKHMEEKGRTISQATTLPSGEGPECGNDSRFRDYV